jgi:penicillin-binding protein 2
VVVLEIESGEVIAMASSPALDGYPWLNRAAYGLYPPGSIIKPLVLVAAMTEGELRPDESIECTGHYFEHVTDAARCWIYRSKYNYQTHGHLKPVEAIARSCNFFFYDLGTRLGLERLSDWLQKFGMSKPLAVQLTHEHDSGTQGHVPTQADINKLRKRGALKFETVSVAIGQGTLTWTPLQAAAAFATLARGGVWLSPSLVKGLHQQTEDLNLNQESVSLALQGLHDSISKPYGTGARLHSPATNNEPTFNVDSIRIWGKTGTAQAPSYRLNDGSKLSGLDHSWFVVMASTMNNPHPEFVVAVLVEHGGSGGLVAGPIANQILHALQAEGYLESTP